MLQPRRPLGLVDIGLPEFVLRINGGHDDTHKSKKHAFGFLKPAGHSFIYFQALKHVFHHMTRAVKRGVIRLGIFDIFPRGNAGLTVLSAEGVTQFPAVISFIAGDRDVFQIFQKVRSHGNVAGVSGGDFHGCGEPAHHINHHMNFRVEPAA